jgi:hypothetical protein
MKDKFNDFFDRFRNPFVSSFIISWLVINWPITIALIFDNHESLMLIGFTDYVTLIKYYLEPINSFFFPLMSAIVFTIGFPRIKAAVRKYNKQIEYNNEEEILTSTSEIRVSLKKFEFLKKEYMKKLKKLDELIEEEKVSSVENVYLRQNVAELEGKIKNINEESLSIAKEMERNLNLSKEAHTRAINKYSRFSLDGQYKVFMGILRTSTLFTEMKPEFEIRVYQGILSAKLREDNYQILGNIELIEYDIRSKRIKFLFNKNFSILNTDFAESVHSIFNLNFSFIKGTIDEQILNLENQTINFTWVKIEQTE